MTFYPRNASYLSTVTDFFIRKNRCNCGLVDDMYETDQCHLWGYRRLHLSSTVLHHTHSSKPQSSKPVSFLPQFPAKYFPEYLSQTDNNNDERSIAQLDKLYLLPLRLPQYTINSTNCHQPTNQLIVQSTIEPFHPFLHSSLWTHSLLSHC